jgi:streptogramin lyase
MRSIWRALLACVVCGLVGLASWSAVARAEEASTGVGSGSSVFSNPTVVVGSPEEAQELQYERESRLDNPEAAEAREASQTKFEGLDSEQARKLAGESFPQIVKVPAGGSPQLPTGQRIVAYPTPNTARLELANGKSAVLESLSPIAIQTSSNTQVPIDLILSESANQFQPARGLVGVGIPKRLADGISLPEQGVSLTPSNAQGQSLAGSEGSLVGASVLYANTQSDTDTLVKPTTNGFNVDVLLRSIQSPEELYFRVGMPAGAKLVGDAQGGAQVMIEGQTIASVLPPAAQDSAESPVPVSMSVSDDLLVVSVNHRAGAYQYPIDVDPSIIDSQLAASGAKRANWEFKSEPSGSTKFGHTNAACKGPGEQYLETCATGEYKNGEFAVWIYQTRGNSKIFEFKGETEAENTSAKIESIVELQNSSGGLEEKEQLSSELKEPKYAKRALPEALCPKGKSTCTSSYGGEKNAVHFQQSVTGSGSKFSDYLYVGEVSITEPEERATTKYNTTSPELEGEVINVKGEKEKIKRKNVLDGGGWLSEHDGAAELISEDKGIGVSATQLEFESSPGKWEQIAKHNYLSEEYLCKGYQCEPKDEEFWVLSPKLPNGEDKIRYRAEDGMGSSTESTESEGVATVKVDASKPRKLAIGGLPYGNELSERPYPLTVYATDGEGTTIPSSGIESIALYIDGSLIGTNGGTGGKEGTEGKCSEPKGQCTASAKWTFNGAELGAGKHQIEVIAHDRAGNEERFYDPISIRHSTPVAMGPGSVDLESGDFSLSSTDVSMGSGLTVSRAYSSRALEEGIEGPLGPQWNMTVGGSAESLVELVDHSMMLTGSNGRQTIFAKTETTTYESPVGDSNLTLKLEENKETKTKEAFYLEDLADHTKVKFTLPYGGTNVWVPTRQEGAVATDTVTYSYQTVEQSTEYALPSGSRPEGIAAGPDGHLWFVDESTSKIGKIATSGVVIEYALPGGSQPYAITAGPDGNLWFTETKTEKIGKITPSGVITEYSLPAESGAVGITVGPDKNLWFTSTGRSKIGKITTAGIATVYSLPEGSKPYGITSGPDGNVWFAEEGTHKIGKITTSGVITEYSVPEGSPLNITVGPDGNLWFTNYLSNKIGKITTAGTITEYTLPNEGPFNITTGPEGDLWFTNPYVNHVGKITTSGSVTEYKLPAGSSVGGLATGPDSNLWFALAGSSTIGMMTPSGTITEPTEALAPVPAKVSCAPTMNAGCRALKFQYASATTAKGENQSEWGTYNGRLTRILLEAYNRSVKKWKNQPSRNTVTTSWVACAPSGTPGSKKAQHAVGVVQHSRRPTATTKKVM